MRKGAWRCCIPLAESCRQKYVATFCSVLPFLLFSPCMNDDAFRFLSLPRLPGRLTIAQTATLLGVANHDIAVLIRSGLLRPLGRPEPNAPKFFSSKVVEGLANDPDAMDKVTKAIAKGWRIKNERQRELGHHTEAEVTPAAAS
jgi:hypothetical protein